MKLINPDQLLIRILILILPCLLFQVVEAQVLPILKVSDIACGADCTREYFGLAGDVRVGVVANPTSRIGDAHLLDTLLNSGIAVKKVFAPEHGFRGEAEAGELISGSRDTRTGLPVISLYGSHYKPTPGDLEEIDLLIFDIQDVGVRFYTYVSTLHYVMESCAEAEIPLIVLDRPNPNGFYVDGPVLDTSFRSFVGMHPVPVVHGMTVGEYAMMINGEGWLAGGLRCDLTVVPCKGYDHQTEYILPVKPSPNLPNQLSVYLYPSLCFFEGTPVSVGRGTPDPFQVYGHPGLSGAFRFTPRPVKGASLHPLQEGILCYGEDLRKDGINELAREPRLILDWLIDSYKQIGSKGEFFNGYFDTLAGSDVLRKQIISGLSAAEIRSTWKDGIDRFLKTRKKYLLYPDSLQE